VLPNLKFDISSATRNLKFLPPHQLGIVATLVTISTCTSLYGIDRDLDYNIDLPEPESATNYPTDAEPLPIFLSPLSPETFDFGSDVINALATDPLGPVNDPNVDSVPNLGEPEIQVIDIPKEAENKIWRIRPYLKTGVTYDDNIFLTNTNRVSDIIYNVEGGFAFEMGDYRDLLNNFLLLEYLASGFFFTNHSAQNSLNQNYSLLAQYRVAQLAVQLESTLQSLDGADRQVGQFTSRVLFFNAIRFLYAKSEKIELELEINQRTNYYPDQISSYTWETQIAMDYKIQPKLSAGLQAIFGLNEVQESPDRLYQSINALFDYEVAEKLALKASIGLQFNQYTSGGEAMRILPVFSVGGEYQVFQKTTLAITGYRNLQASPSFIGQDFIATGFELGVKQQVAQKIALGLAFGYENDTYVASIANVAALRVDNFYFIRPEISYSFLKYAAANLMYEYRSNSSTIDQYNWPDNQLSFELSLDF
jgi:hypothetical protein